MPEQLIGRDSAIREGGGACQVSRGQRSELPTRCKKRPLKVNKLHPAAGEGAQLASPGVAR